MTTELPLSKQARAFGHRLFLYGDEWAVLGPQIERELLMAAMQVDETSPLVKLLLRIMLDAPSNELHFYKFWPGYPGSRLEALFAAHAAAADNKTVT